MFNNRNKNNPDPRYMDYQNNPNMNSMYPNLEMNRLLYEIKENRRRINNLAKRITRIESYLRIKDTNEFGYIEDNQNPNDYSF
jgi:hypothetical protein